MRQPAVDALVSAVMAVYNGSEYIGEAIESVLAQTHSRIELIIVDDGSKDDTVEIVRRRMRGEPRISLIERPHCGQAKALNAGVAAAQGAFIARIDHDDLWRRDRLSTQLPWMLDHGIDVCGSWVRRFGTSKKIMRFPRSHEAICYETLFTCPILDSATTFRGDVLRANLYPPGAIVRQELEQCVRLLPKYRFGNVMRCLAFYRSHMHQKTRRFAPLINYRQIQLCTQHFSAMYPDAPEEFISIFQRLIDGFLPSRPEPHEVAELFGRYLKPRGNEARARMRRKWRRYRTKSRQS